VRARLQIFGKGCRHAHQCRSIENFTVVSEHHAELGLADAHRVLQHGLEDRLELAGRAGNYTQHLGGRRLLLWRLGELLFQVGVGCAKAANVSSRLRCLRTKTGNASSALRPFASQDHLVGTVTGPPSGRPSQGSRPSILTEPHDELAPPHSITSSAVASSVGGTGRSSILAVWALMTSSNLVACTTANSAGLAPLRRRPT